MSEKRYGSFTCYLGDGQFDYVTLPLSDGIHPTELGDAVDHFEKLYPARSWKMYSTGAEESDPLYTHLTPEQRKVADTEAALRQAELLEWAKLL